MSGTRTAHDVAQKQRTDDIRGEESVDFAGLLLSEPVLQGLTKAGFERPSPIQLKAIPLGRCGLDLIVQAKSGTGKTCVFSVIALESILLEGNTTQILILAPTREIAVQIWEVINSIGSMMPQLRCYTFIGGLPVAEDIKKLKRCHIAVGTPGRVMQLIEMGELQTTSVRLFVLDEADKMMEEGMQETVNWIYSSLPENKQMLAVSATYPEVLAKHLTAYMRNPTFVRLNTSDPALLGIRQYYKLTAFHPLPQKAFQNKVDSLLKLLTSVTFNQCLVFSNYQMRAQSLSDMLNEKGWPSTYISGSQDQEHRLTAMAKLKMFKCRVLISTDLTSRGIDAEHVNLVVNLDLPRDSETYLHRIGRAGRFGTYGAGVTLASAGTESNKLREIEKKCNTKIVELPDPVPNDLCRSSGYVNLDKLVSTETIITDDVTAKTGDVTAKTGDVTAKNGDVTAKTSDVTAKTGDVTAKTGDVMLKNSDHTAKNGDDTAKNGDVTAKNGDVTATNGDVTEKNGDVCTNSDGITENNGDLTAKTADVTSKTSDITVKCDVNTPKTCDVSEGATTRTDVISANNLLTENANVTQVNNSGLSPSFASDKSQTHLPNKVPLPHYDPPDLYNTRPAGVDEQTDAKKNFDDTPTIGAKSNEETHPSISEPPPKPQNFRLPRSQLKEPKSWSALEMVQDFQDFLASDDVDLSGKMSSLVLENEAKDSPSEEPQNMNDVKNVLQMMVHLGYRNRELLKLQDPLPNPGKEPGDPDAERKLAAAAAAAPPPAADTPTPPSAAVTPAAPAAAAITPLSIGDASGRNPVISQISNTETLPQKPTSESKHDVPEPACLENPQTPPKSMHAEKQKRITEEDMTLGMEYIKQLCHRDLTSESEYSSGTESDVSSSETEYSSVSGENKYVKASRLPALDRGVRKKSRYDRRAGGDATYAYTADDEYESNAIYGQYTEQEQGGGDYHWNTTTANQNAPYTAGANQDPPHTYAANQQPPYMYGANQYPPYMPQQPPQGPPNQQSPYITPQYNAQCDWQSWSNPYSHWMAAYYQLYVSGQCFQHYMYHTQWLQYLQHQHKAWEQYQRLQQKCQDQHAYIKRMAKQ